MTIRTLLLSALTASTTCAMAQHSMHHHSRYGGPVSMDQPRLDVTASLIAAGGGAEHYSTLNLLVSLVGEDAAKLEAAKLNKQYGAASMDQFIKVADFTVNDAIAKATALGVTIPAPTLKGTELAQTLVSEGRDKDGTFYTELLLDKNVGHELHVTVMDDINVKFGPKADAEYHRIANQIFFDLGQALHIQPLKLSKNH